MFVKNLSSIQTAGRLSSVDEILRASVRFDGPVHDGVVIHGLLTLSFALKGPNFLTTLNAFPLPSHPDFECHRSLVNFYPVSGLDTTPSLLVVINIKPI